MVGSETLANAVGQYRNAYINSLLNKSDPFLASHFAQLILAGLPPDPEAETEDNNDPNKLPIPPEPIQDFENDPDGILYNKKAFEYAKALMMYAEQKQAKAVYETLARYRAE